MLMYSLADVPVLDLKLNIISYLHTGIPILMFGCMDFNEIKGMEVNIADTLI